MVKKNQKIGFKLGFEYLLDFLCYSYYVKSNNLVSDQTFDELEKLYCKMFKKDTAPSRMMEREECYSKGIKVVYYQFFEKESKK